MSRTHRFAIRDAARILLALTAVALGSNVAEGAEHRLLLSWNRPYAKPGASDAIASAPTDTSRVDTLYLTFQMSRPSPAVESIHAFVYFRPGAGDTLGDFWAFKSGQTNGGSLEVDFAPLQDISSQFPWTDHGDYSVSWDKVGDAGRLSFEQRATEPNESVGLDPGVSYCFARVRIAHRRAHLSGHAQPVCVEWGGARVRFTTGREIVLRGDDQGIVRWNSARDCKPQTATTRPWMPTPGGR